MKIVISKTPESLGMRAAEETAALIKAGIEKDGIARIILSTGASQFTTLEALTARNDIDWQKVEMFHLDEYVNLPITHPASFRKYLQERFVDKTGIRMVHFVDGTKECIEVLGKELDKAPIHVGLIGIGQNSHIAFNDPPADFDTQDPYLIVNLDPVCRGQQVHEGWFATVDDVPAQAVSMSVSRIMKCEHIISAVPYPEKAEAIRKTLNFALTNMYPATMLKNHPNFSLYVDQDSIANADLNHVIPGENQNSWTMEVYSD